MLTVSVIIATHNEGNSLARTVDNLLSTMPPGAEIIVVDDLSSDGSVAAVSRTPAVRLPEVQIGPFAFDADVRFVDTPALVRRF